MEAAIDMDIESLGLRLPLRRYTEDDAGKIELPASQLEKDAGSRLIAKLRERKENGNQGGERTPVLLLHGASAGRQTFEIPRALNFVNFLLLYTNLEPWLLDWRGSRNVTDPMLTGGRFDDGFTFDEVARSDIPGALQRIRAEYPDSKAPIRALGHCMGAATLAQAIASGELAEKHTPTHIVLSTIGLFYEVPVDGRLKASDHLLERLLSGEETGFVDPTWDRDKDALRHPWPKELTEMYDTWPDWLRPHATASGRENHEPGAGHRHVMETCNRLSFMYGEPYYEPALVPEIHDDPGVLTSQFGAIPLSMYVHAAQCVRRGWIARFNAGIDEGEDEGGIYEFVNDAARGHFDGMDVTLITGGMNRLWHRDSVDRMYEWLRRGRPGDRCRKLIFGRNGHQDLFWGSNSWDEVFPRIAEALTTEPEN